MQGHPGAQCDQNLRRGAVAGNETREVTRGLDGGNGATDSSWCP